MGKEILLRYDDGYPEGFSLLDNRDLWSGTGRDRKTLLRPATLGVYVLMCSLPKDWIFREVWLTDRLGVGRDALRRIVRELVKANRLRKDEIRDEKGRYVRTDWILLRGGSPRTGNPSADTPATDCPTTAKSTAGKAADLVNTEAAANTETTTTPVPLDWSARGLKSFTDDERVAVVGLLNRHHHDTQQALLDELAGHIEDKAVKNSPMGLLAKLAAAAQTGDFVLNRGRRIRDERIARKALDAVGKLNLSSSETPYENACQWAYQQFQITGDRPALEARLAEAKAKWPEEASKSPVEALAHGKRRVRQQPRQTSITTGVTP